MAGKRKNSEMNQEAKSAVEQILKGYVVDKISEDLDKEREVIQILKEEDLPEIKEEIERLPKEFVISRIVEKKVNNTEDEIKQKLDEDFKEQKNYTRNMAKKLAEGIQELHKESDIKITELSCKTAELQECLKDTGKKTTEIIKVSEESITAGIGLILEENKKTCDEINKEIGKVHQWANDTTIENRTREEEIKEEVLNKLDVQTKFLKFSIGIGIVNIVGILSAIIIGITGIL